LSVAIDRRPLQGPVHPGWSGVCRKAITDLTTTRRSIPMRITPNIPDPAGVSSSIALNGSRGIIQLHLLSQRHDLPESPRGPWMHRSPLDRTDEPRDAPDPGRGLLSIARWSSRYYKHTAPPGQGAVAARSYKHSAPLEPGCDSGFSRVEGSKIRLMAEGKNFALFEYVFAS